MTSHEATLPSEDLNEYIKALRNYKKIGPKQTRALMETLRNATLNKIQVDELEPSAWIRILNSIQSTDEEEKQLVEEMIDFMRFLYKKYRLNKGHSSEMKTSSPKEDSEDKENISNNNNREKVESQKKSKSLEEKKDEGNENSQGDAQNKDDKGPIEKQDTEDLSKEVRDFTVKILTQGLLLDYKGDPQTKKEIQPVAQEKAEELEKAINDEAKNDEETYRMEARNISNFVLVQK